MSRDPVINLRLCAFKVALILQTPNVNYSWRTAPLTSKRCTLYIYSTNISSEYFKHGIYFPFLFLFKMQFHNSNLFGSCIIHILYTTGVLKLKKNNSGAERLLSSDLNQTLIFTAGFWKIPGYWSLYKFVQLYPSFSMWTDRHRQPLIDTDSHDELIVSVRCLANVHKNEWGTGTAQSV